MVERGEAVEAVAVADCCGREQEVLLLHSIYSNNLVRTNHVCSCLVTSAAQEWIDQSCDDRYPVYRFAAYQRVTG